MEKGLGSRRVGPLGVSYGAVGNEGRIVLPLKPIELTYDPPLQTVSDKTAVSINTMV